MLIKSVDIKKENNENVSVKKFLIFLNNILKYFKKCAIQIIFILEVMEVLYNSL